MRVRSSMKPSGRQQHFHQLTRPWRDRLYSAALRRARVPANAEDWLQETFLRAWRDFDKLNNETSIYYWLLKILDHVIHETVRKDQRRQQIAPVVTTDDIFLREQPSASPGPFEKTLQKLDSQQITSAINSLPDEFSGVILLRDFEELSYSEIADILDIPQGTVMSRLSRGRRLLAKAIIKTQSCKQLPENSSATGTRS